MGEPIDMPRWIAEEFRAMNAQSIPISNFHHHSPGTFQIHDPTLHQPPPHFSFQPIHPPSDLPPSFPPFTTTPTQSATPYYPPMYPQNYYPEPPYNPYYQPQYSYTDNPYYQRPITYSSYTPIYCPEYHHYSDPTNSSNQFSSSYYAPGINQTPPTNGILLMRESLELESPMDQFKEDNQEGSMEEYVSVFHCSTPSSMTALDSCNHATELLFDKMPLRGVDNCEEQLNIYNGNLDTDHDIRMLEEEEDSSNLKIEIRDEHKTEKEEAFEHPIEEIEFPVASTVSSPNHLLFCALQISCEPPPIPLFASSTPPPQLTLQIQPSITTVRPKKIDTKLMELQDNFHTHKVFDLMPESNVSLPNKLIQMYFSHDPYPHCIPIIYPTPIPPLKPPDRPKVFEPSQFQHRQQSITHMQPIQLVLPPYNSDNPFDPLSLAVKYFKYYSISEGRKVEIASLHRDAIPWIDCYQTKNLGPIWQMFAENVLQQIGSRESVEFSIAYLKIKQVYTNLRNLKEDLRCYQPHYVISVPLVFEILYTGIQKQITTSSTARRLVALTFIKISMAYMELRRVYEGKYLTKNQEQHSHFISLLDWMWAKVFTTILWPIHMLANKVVYSKIQLAIGMSKAGINGGGSLPLHVDRFYEAIGVKIQNGYGLTECSPGVAAQDGIWAVLAWLSIIACRNKDKKPGEKLVSVADIVMEYWATYEGNFFSRYDYEECESDGANKIVEYLRNLQTKSKAGEKYGTYILQIADDLAYTDPVDGSDKNSCITTILSFNNFEVLRWLPMKNLDEGMFKQRHLGRHIRFSNKFLWSFSKLEDKLHAMGVGMLRSTFKHKHKNRDSLSWNRR